MTSVEPKAIRRWQSAQHTIRSDAGQSNPPLVVTPEVLQSCGLALRRMGDTGAGSIAVTSTTRREGRTTVAIGLAAASAAQGHETILVDLDVLHRDIKDVVRLADGPGLADYLQGRASADECLQPAGRHLEIVTAGTPSDVEIADRMDQVDHLLKQLKGQCDLLVADLPQLEAGVLVAHMADLFDSVALVVRAGGVAVPLLEQAVSVLGQRPYVIMNATGKSPLRRRLLGRRS